MLLVRISKSSSLILREAFERHATDKRAFESKRFRVVREQPDTILPNRRGAAGSIKN